ncbi:Hypothetical protein NTJ_03741 [Nesidiocoris tenuis]|uniref:DUF5615 domain-containing protein n=1 Tax=Nesidiocoris tenuis TaxID=355587 RepID=A0ABN7AFW5_9HEMI|nr:Hypothetical protein NTJ_03741 [Nesidiocoris tenuis]
MYCTLIAKGYVDEIEHKFQQTGYTFLSCDRDFALIEKEKRVCEPQVPKDLIAIITRARQNKPFLVNYTQTFFDHSWDKSCQ